jgi:hypothetical protein
MRRFTLPAASAIVAMTALILTVFSFYGSSARIFLAPMIDLDGCIAPNSPAAADAQTQRELGQACLGPQGSGAALAESTLSGLQAAGSKSARYELGYTLKVPLLKLFKQQDGDWIVNQEILGRVVRTLRDTDRPAILYLFSTHFGQDAPIEKALAADPANLSWTTKGPLQTGVYYTAPIYNWTFATPRTAITERRIQAARAVLREICKLEPRHIKKIRGITLLGELHHLFPDFEAGMGFARPYLISDYSQVSKIGFRAFLQKHSNTISNFNANIGTDWTSFDQVEPPSKDVRTTPLHDFTEHIDSFAHGFLPISGWAYVKEATESSPAMVRIYRNGELIGRVPVNLGRQDVLAARPEFGTANTGWRFDMDFRKLPAGIYQIDVLLENGLDDLVRFGTRQIAIVDKHQHTPQPQPQKALPSNRVADASMKAYLDTPSDQSSYYYNPLVPYWHAFRAQQVVDYLQNFNQEISRDAGTSCLSHTQRYTHQLIPYTNPSWDETKYAVDASLQKLNGIDLGISLYGEPTYGTSFSRWFATTKHRHYGVTEFHPLKALNTMELQNVLESHAGRGVRFISFFAEPRWKGKSISLHHNLFSFDPDNPEFGSTQLYESMREVLSGAPKAAP